MHTVNTKFERAQRFWFLWVPLTTAVALFLTLVVWVRSTLAQEPAQPNAQASYASAEDAGQALYEAVLSDNMQSILQILGDRKELASSGDDQEDKGERKQFAAKYEEMHRWVRQADANSPIIPVRKR